MYLWANVHGGRLKKRGEITQAVKDERVKPVLTDYSILTYS